VESLRAKRGKKGARIIPFGAPPKIWVCQGGEKGLARGFLPPEGVLSKGEELFAGDKRKALRDLC